jgi:hypothetical protein
MSGKKFYKSRLMVLCNTDPAVQFYAVYVGGVGEM